MKVLCLGLPKDFYDEFSADALLKEFGMDPESIAESVMEEMG